MSCINRNQCIRHTHHITDTSLSETFCNTITPVFCACMIAARGMFSGSHTGILKMQYQFRYFTEFIHNALFGVVFYNLTDRFGIYSFIFFKR